jgi:hypothetical protein
MTCALDYCLLTCYTALRMLTYADVHVGQISLKSVCVCVRAYVRVCVRARSLVCVVCARVHMHNRHLCVPKKNYIITYDL